MTVNEKINDLMIQKRNKFNSSGCTPKQFFKIKGKKTKFRGITINFGLGN